MTRTDQAWPLRVGMNIGDVFVVAASLSGLLWQDTASRAGVEISDRRYASVGARVGLPALLIATLLAVTT